MTRSPKPRTKLTESQWRDVFHIRCLSKRGQHVTQDQHDLCTVALAENRKRYAGMDRDVFNETAPFGARRR